MTCPAAYASGCEHTMIGEAIVWHGDAATAPEPTTVAQAAAAFGISTKPVAGICESYLPGAVVLQYPASTSGSMSGWEGVVAVFPSAAAVAAADPDAAAYGESPTWPRSAAWAATTAALTRSGVQASSRSRTAGSLEATSWWASSTTRASVPRTTSS